MTLTIGSQVIEVTRCTRMRDTQRGFYLDISIPKGTITMDELEKIFDNNEYSIIVSSETEENIYTGFKQLSSLSLENGVYKVIQVCTSEMEAQLSIVQSQMAVQEKKLTVAENECIAQTTRLNEQEETSAELLYQVCLLQLGLTEEDL